MYSTQSGIDLRSQPSDNGSRCEVPMRIRVELNPEMERQLTAEALARGIALESYAQRLLQGAITSSSKTHAREPGRISCLLGCSLRAKRRMYPNCGPRPSHAKRSMVSTPDGRLVLPCGHEHLEDPFCRTMAGTGCVLYPFRIRLTPEWVQGVHCRIYSLAAHAVHCWACCLATWASRTI